jgi:hypothetical protein
MFSAEEQATCSLLLSWHRNLRPWRQGPYVPSDRQWSFKSDTQFPQYALPALYLQDNQRGPSCIVELYLAPRVTHKLKSFAVNGRARSVGIVARLWAARRRIGVRFKEWLGDLPSPQRFYHLEHTKTPMPWVLATCSQGVKRVERDSDNSPHANACRYTSNDHPHDVSVNYTKGKPRLLLPCSNFRKWRFHGCQEGLQNSRCLKGTHPVTSHSAASKNKVSGQKTTSTCLILLYYYYYYYYY